LLTSFVTFFLVRSSLLDGDGFISRAEAEVKYAADNSGSNQEELVDMMEAFMGYDTNGDGKLDVGELALSFWGFIDAETANPTPDEEGEVPYLSEPYSSGVDEAEQANSADVEEAEPLKMNLKQHDDDRDASVIRSPFDETKGNDEL
jgi:hypothetical protein